MTGRDARAAWVAHQTKKPGGIFIGRGLARAGGGPKGDLYYVTPFGYRRHLSRE